MEILIGIVVIGVVAVLCRLWLSGSDIPTSETESARYSSGSALFRNGADSGIFDPTVQSLDDSSSVPTGTNSGSSDVNVSPDCAASGSDDSSRDCSCPVDNSSYDSGGCSVDSSSFDPGNTN